MLVNWFMKEIIYNFLSERLVRKGSIEMAPEYDFLFLVGINGRHICNIIIIDGSVIIRMRRRNIIDSKLFYASPTFFDDLLAKCVELLSEQL